MYENVHHRETRKNYDKTYGKLESGISCNYVNELCTKKMQWRLQFYKVAEKIKPCYVHGLLDIWQEINVLKLLNYTDILP